CTLLNSDATFRSLHTSPTRLSPNPRLTSHHSAQMDGKPPCAPSRPGPTARGGNSGSALLDLTEFQIDRHGPAEDRHLDLEARALDRKSTRLNSSHVKISYAILC